MRLPVPCGLLSPPGGPQCSLLALRDGAAEPFCTTAGVLLRPLWIGLPPSGPRGLWCPCAPRQAPPVEQPEAWVPLYDPPVFPQARPTALPPSQHDPIVEVSPTVPCGQPTQAAPLHGHRTYAPHAASAHGAGPRQTPEVTAPNWAAHSWQEYMKNQVNCRRVLVESREFLNLAFTEDPAMGGLAADRDPMGVVYHLRDFLNTVCPTEREWPPRS